AGVGNVVLGSARVGAGESELFTGQYESALGRRHGGQARRGGGKAISQVLVVNGGQAAGKFAIAANQADHADAVTQFVHGHRVKIGEQIGAAIRVGSDARWVRIQAIVPAQRRVGGV